MKKFLVIGAFIIYVAVLFSSCGKSVKGCTDSTALNYNSNATINDGSCVYSGSIMFWSNALSLHGGSIIVTLDNAQTTTVSTNYTSAQPCGTVIGGDMLLVPVGTHTYTTKDAFNGKSSGSVVVTQNGCSDVQLN